ncbi:MAG TPA: hypothetical protein VN841_11560 [Bryobacteraceae bacterium]|nr:hypothetical protein [Bryobacteraceae bacterium]
MRIQVSDDRFAEQNRARVRIAFRAAATMTLLLGMEQAAPAATSPGSNTMWVYSVAGLPSPVTDPSTRDTLMQNASASGVTALYVSVYSSTANSAHRYLVDEKSIAAFIRKAHSRNMQVYASMGDTEWPAKGCATPATPHERFADIAGYDSDHPAVKFDGIILDVEPGRNPDFPALLSLYRCFQRQAAASGLGLSAAVSAFWNTRSPSTGPPRRRTNTSWI